MSHGGIEQYFKDVMEKSQLHDNFLMKFKEEKIEQRKITFCLQ